MLAGYWGTWWHFQTNIHMLLASLKLVTSQQRRHVTPSLQPSGPSERTKQCVCQGWRWCSWPHWKAQCTLRMDGCSPRSSMGNCRIQIFAAAAETKHGLIPSRTDKSGIEQTCPRHPCTHICDGRDGKPIQRGKCRPAGTGYKGDIEPCSCWDCQNTPQIGTRTVPLLCTAALGKQIKVPSVMSSNRTSCCHSVL